MPSEVSYIHDLAQVFRDSYYQNNRDKVMKQIKDVAQAGEFRLIKSFDEEWQMLEISKGLETEGFKVRILQSNDYAYEYKRPYKIYIKW